MKNPYSEIEEKARQAGVSVSAACKRAGVDRSVPERWKKNVPKSLVTYAGILEAIDDLKKEKDQK